MFEWTVSVRKERSAGWYAAAGIGVASLIVWGFFEGLYALSVVVVIFSGVFLLIENNAPDSVLVSVNENGIGIGTDFYDYGIVSSFALIFDAGAPIYLRLKLNKKSIRTIDIDIPPGSDVSNLRAYLAGYAEEAKDAELTFSERLLRNLGF